jgi:hypothetical protein
METDYPNSCQYKKCPVYMNQYTMPCVSMDVCIYRLLVRSDQTLEHCYEVIMTKDVSICVLFETVMELWILKVKYSTEAISRNVP